MFLAIFEREIHVIGDRSRLAVKFIKEAGVSIEATSGIKASSVTQDLDKNSNG